MSGPVAPAFFYAAIYARASAGSIPDAHSAARTNLPVEAGALQNVCFIV